MLAGSSVRRVLGTIVVAGVLLEFLPPCASANSYTEAINRALGLLPRQPERVVLVERANGSNLSPGTPRREAFAYRGGKSVFLMRQGATLQGALKGPGIFDFALAAIIWHEMAHIDGADEAAAREAEENLWREFILRGRVDRTRGIQYLVLLSQRR